MLAIIRYTMITALRDKLFIGLLGVILLAIFVSTFLGGTALSEQYEMVISYACGSSRLILAVGMVIFVCFHVKRMFDNKEIEFILAKPISRNAFICSYWLAFVVLVIILSLLSMAFIAIFTKPNLLGLLYWTASVICEEILIIAFAIVSALILKSAVASVMATLCFYFLSRMMGFFVAIIKQPFNLQLPELNYVFDWISQWLLQLTSTVLPRLDLFGKTKWLIYGIATEKELWIFACQSLVYIPLLLVMAMLDFNKKQF